MRTTYWMLAGYGLLALLLAGCGGGDASPLVADEAGTGGLMFRVAWPDETPTGARAIPTGTQRIVVTAKRQLTTLKEMTITRPASTGTLTGLTPGTVSLSARAYADSGALLASGATSVTIVAGQNVAAPITLSDGSGGGTAGQTKIDPSTGATMVYIPAGEFLMGTPTSATYDHWNEEHPQRRVYLDGFWMMRDAVTVAQYRAFCAATGRGLPSVPSYGIWSGRTWAHALLQQHPMVNVTWYDAKAYADWAGLALPTEAQREKASRGTDGRLWPWGNTWDATKCANWTNSQLSHAGLSGYGTWPVGSFPAGNSPYGCRDMAGNVWEWCADWWQYDATVGQPSANPTGPSTGSSRVLRGGSWYYYNDGNFRTAFRDYGGIPGYWYYYFGFRCASPPPGR